MRTTDWRFLTRLGLSRYYADSVAARLGFEELPEGYCSRLRRDNSGAMVLGQPAQKSILTPQGGCDCFCSGAWIRTKIHSSRGYGPTVRRPRNFTTSIFLLLMPFLKVNNLSLEFFLLKIIYRLS